MYICTCTCTCTIARLYVCVTSPHTEHKMASMHQTVTDCLRNFLTVSWLPYTQLQSTDTITQQWLTNLNHVSWGAWESELIHMCMYMYMYTTILHAVIEFCENNLLYAKSPQPFSLEIERCGLWDHGLGLQMNKIHNPQWHRWDCRYYMYMYMYMYMYTYM